MESPYCISDLPKLERMQLYVIVLNPVQILEAWLMYKPPNSAIKHNFIKRAECNWPVYMTFI
jgi:hypothetical protein